MKAEIDAAVLTKHLTMQVDIRGVNTLRFRLWIGLALIRLAVRAIGCKLEIKS